MRLTHSTHTHTHRHSYKFLWSFRQLFFCAFASDNSFTKDSVFEARKESLARQWQVTWDLTSGLMDVNYRGPPQLSSTWQLSHQVFGILAQLCPFHWTGGQAVSSRAVQEATVFPHCMQTSLTSGLKTDRQTAETQICTEKGSFSPKDMGEGPKCGTMVVFHVKYRYYATIWQLKHVSKELRLSRILTLNKAVNGSSQPLPVRRFLPKKGQNVAENHFTLLKIKNEQSYELMVTKGAGKRTGVMFCVCFFLFCASIFVPEHKWFSGSFQTVVSVRVRTSL